MAAIDISSPASGGGGGGGNLQLSGGASMTSTLTSVTDTSNTSSPLKLSTTAVQVLSPLRITTSDASGFYLDAEDSATNNRFSIKRDPSSQLVTLDFASNPAGSTTAVGAIRTYVDGVNLSEAMTFREDGNVGIGTTAPTYKFMVSDNSANDGAVFFEKDLLGGQSDCYVYNKNASTNLTTGALIGTLSFGGYFNSNYSPGVQDVAAIFGFYTGTGTNRKGQLQFRTHDSSGMQQAMTINENQLVGIGETTPTARLHVLGKGSTSATTSLLVQNSAGTEIASFRDDLRVSVRSEFRVLDSAGNNAMIMYGDGYSGTKTLWVNGDLGVGVLGNNASARLQIDSTTQGFLPPRMTDAQRAAISSPAEGLLVYNTDNHAVAYRDGTNWGYLCGALQNVTGAGGTQNILFASGNIVNLTLNASTTLTFSGHVVGTYIIQVTQGGAGSNTLTYPASVKWSGGTAPTLTTTVGKTDILTFYHDGTSFFGTYSLNY